MADWVGVDVPQRTCSFEFCGSPHVAGGWCGMHYKRWWKWGNPAQIGPPPISRLERLLSGVIVMESGCWQWPSTMPDGYGFSQAGGVRQMAHRAVYRDAVGPIPDGFDLDHICHNRDAACPGGSTCAHRSCVNPDHLEPVPHIENVQRSLRNNWLSRKTHCPKGHPYSGKNLYVNPRGERICRECRRLAKHRYRAR